MPLTIGEFARLGGVSTRMLRHYDGLGLLEPDRVDPSSGYRYYAAAQLDRLNRLLALRDLGFGLEELRPLLDGDPEAVAEQLADRRQALESAIEADRRRLAAVDARLHLLSANGPDLAIVEKPLPQLNLAQLSATVEDAGQLGSVVGPLFQQLEAKLAHRGLSTALPSYAWYLAKDDLMHFGVGYPAHTDQPGRGVELHVLQAEPLALTAIHNGPITAIDGTWQALALAAESRGMAIAGPGREVYLDVASPDWVVEVQFPTTPVTR